VTDENYDELTNEQLKDKLRDRTDKDGNSLPLGGAHDELVKRLKDADKAEAKATAKERPAATSAETRTKASTGAQTYTLAAKDTPLASEMTSALSETRNESEAQRVKAAEGRAGEIGADTHGGTICQVERCGMFADVAFTVKDDSLSFNASKEGKAVKGDEVYCATHGLHRLNQLIGELYPGQARRAAVVV
jgi:hypothetical protein